MRLIALSIVIFSGAMMASVGVVANALLGAHRYSDLDIWGLVLIGLACVLFLLEWVRGRARPAEALTLEGKLARVA